MNNNDVPVVQIQDRTGYYPFFILSLIFISLGLFGIVIETKTITTTTTTTPPTDSDTTTAITSSPLLFYIYNIFFVIGVIGFITTDGISSPPSNGPYQYLLKKKKKKNVQQQQHEESQSQSQQQKQSKSKVLVCLGDSLTHGKCSDNWIDRIHTDERIADRSFNIDIVNAGQNNICTHTVLKTKIYHVTQCQPQYVFVMIGTNDVMCMYRDDWSNDKIRMWSLPTKPTVEIYEKNLRSIIKYLLSKNRGTQIGLATLPPMGEDFNSKSNQLIRQINHIIYKVASDSNEEEDDDDTGKDSTVAAAATATTTKRRRRVRIIEVYDALKAEIISRRSSGIQQQQQQNIYNVDNFLLAAMIMNVLHHIFGIKWNALTKYVTRNVVMSDSLHLNEDGGNIVKNLVIDWLLSSSSEEEKEEEG